MQTSGGEAELDAQAASAILTIVDDDVPTSGGGGTGAVNFVMLAMLALAGLFARMTWFSCRGLFDRRDGR